MGIDASSQTILTSGGDLELVLNTSLQRSACLLDRECRKSTSLLILKLLGTSVYCLGAMLLLHH